MLMIFTASLLGSLVALPALITGRKRLTSRLPFGPFLIAATVLVLFFGSEVINYYQTLFE
jgi:prepilin signal peptidase PulO-like enzyme (type II secretory pathway)